MKTVAIDLDGTLITCRPRQQALLRSMLPVNRLGQLDEVWALRRSGNNLRTALCRIGMEEKVAAEISDRWIREVEQPGWLRLDSPFEGTIDALQTLRREEWTIRLLTARQNSHWVRMQVFHLGLDRSVDQLEVVSPASAGTEKTATLRKWKPAAMIGDSESDFYAAGNAEVPFIAVGTGQRSAEFLRGKGCPVVVPDFPRAAVHLMSENFRGVRTQRHEDHENH